MVSKKLLDSYERFKKMHKAAIFGYFIVYLGFIFLVGGVLISVIISALFNSLELFFYSIIGCVVFGFILLFKGSEHHNRNIISKEKELFLEVFESLEIIETYQQEEIEFLRYKAAKKLLNVERQITVPSLDYPLSLWKALIKEEIGNLSLFKLTFRERLLPIITRGTGGEIKTVYSILEKFAQYLLNPTVSELKDLNNSMSELPKYIEKKALIGFHCYKTHKGYEIVFEKDLFRQPYMLHAYAIIIFSGTGYFVYRLGIGIGASIDSAYTVGMTSIIYLIVGYMAYLLKGGVSKNNQP